MATENKPLPNALFQLVGSPVPEIASAAFRAIELRSKLANKAISQEEYDELFDDITRLDRIDSEMFTEEVFLGINQAYTIIMTLKSII